VGAIDLVAIGSSWGGLRAVSVILSGLPTDLGAAVVVAQHRSATSTTALARVLEAHGGLPIREVEDKDLIEPGCIYLAPADYHVLVELGSFSLSLAARVQYSRPSIDVLFESAADSYGRRVLAVVLTGANEDGADGLRRVRAAGGLTVVQDPAAAESPIMPAAAVATGAADKVLPLAEIAPFVVQVCGRRSPGTVSR
jgi:two-component system chemotaxis response regulator CheB